MRLDRDGRALVYGERDDGSRPVVLVGDFDAGGRLRIHMFQIEDSADGRQAGLVAWSDLEKQGARPVWKTADSALMGETMVDMLAPGTADRIWQHWGAAGGPASFYGEHRTTEQRALAQLADARIAVAIGEEPPGLADRAVFLDDCTFDEMLEAPDGVLGFYDQRDGSIVVRSNSSDVLGTLIHEGLHALRNERAASTIPRQLDEALTEHFTRVIEPASTVALIERDHLAGKTVYRIPGLGATVETSDERFETRHLPYDEYMSTTTDIENVVGRSVLWRFYRSGDAAEIRFDYDRERGAGAWARLMDEMPYLFDA